MNVSNFLGELKRRNVYRVAVTYAVVSWLLIQIATQVSPYFNIPNWTVRVVILLLVLCFPVALILAWAFELTAEGFVRTEDVPPHKSVRRRTGRKLIAFTSVAAALAIGLFLVRNAILDSPHGPPSGTASAAAAQTIPEKSIAVLPFANLSKDQENGFFADGVQDEILATLAKIADLKVISRTSVQVYKSGAPRNLREIAQQLGVAHVLEGSVQRFDNRVRVTAQLIDARTDAHLWAEHFDRELADTFAIQSDIAQAIAGQLKTTLSPSLKAALEQPTRDVEAFDLYLRAKQLITSFDDAPDRKEALLRALRLLDEAISRDPQFALAYCWATTAHDNLYWFGYDRSPARLALAKASAQTALTLAPDLGEAHLAQALVYYHGSRDYTHALEQVAIAQRTLPSNAEVYSLLGWIERRQGRWDDAVKNLEKAAELDPRNPKVLNALSVIYDFLRRYDDKEALYERSVAINPATHDYFQLFRAATELEKGNIDAARSLLQSLPADYDPEGVASYTRIVLALYARQPDAAAQVVGNLKLEELSGAGGFLLPRSWFEAVIALARGDAARARAAFTDARAKVAAKLRNTPDDALQLAVLSLADAGLGRAREAITEGMRAVKLLPIAEDAMDGPTVLASLAMAYAWVGDVDSAIDQLTILEKTPGGPDYGELKYSPAWDALRSDPRFAQIVASAEPHPKPR
jgi:TolB-like protein/Tfp pilus assembly protein PilF